ncbi:recombinase family protein [Streptomyces chitinivorans]|uniref:Recombinase family protein n=1 Tax=Streptomyces chitinivorans TaxID=1257027 RepID=A0ABW7HTD2_9ACTN|nr:recombinase family protein [Streptomyces chitinivorans]MDH2409619.1 recombinase family protein [Streptomyces chitinivorans]
MIPTQHKRLRAAIYARLSRDDDSSQSVNTQVADGRAWCALRGYDVVLVAIDSGVSGAVRPEDREGFREILDQIHGIDVVVARSLDRYSRHVSHFANLVELLDSHGTTLADVAGQCDLTSPYGRFVVTLMVAFAQLERETIQGRILRSRQQLRSNGQWLGGAAPYGFRIVPDGRGGKQLDLDPRTAPILRRVVKRVIEGHTLSAEVDRLNAEGILSPADWRKAQRGQLPPPAPGYSAWSYSPLYEHLRSPVLRGYRVQGKRSERRVVRDSEGQPIRVGPPLVDDETWARLQAALDRAASTPRRPRKKASLLLHVAYCAVCTDDALYFNSREYGNGKRRDVYGCMAARSRAVRETGPCPGTTVTAARLEETVESWLLDKYGDWPFAEVVEVGGYDNRARVAELRSDIDELAASLVGLRGAAKDAVLRQLDARQEALEEALNEPVQPRRKVMRETGRTVSEEWAARDTAGRRLLLLSLGVRAEVQPAYGRRAWDADRVSLSAGRFGADPYQERMAEILDEEAAAEL